MFLAASLLCLAPLALAQVGPVINPKTASYSTAASLPLNISSLANNRGFAMSPNDADFDGYGSGYPAQYLPPPNFTCSGVNFIFPQYQASGCDNVLAQGQILYPPKGRYFSVHMLVAAEGIIATGSINASYSDNTTLSGALFADPFWSWLYPYGGEVIFPYYLTNESIDYNRSMIYQTINWLNSTKDLVSLQLPNVTASPTDGPGGALQATRLHIFAISMVPAPGSGHGINLEVQYARSTNMWIEGTNKTQIVEVTVNNVGDQWLLVNNSVTVSVSASGLKTVKPAVINRLRPGDQAIVQVGVENVIGVIPGTKGSAKVQINGKGVNTTAFTFNATYGIPTYEPTYESIYAHESPMWYKNAKFGIFIHWGLYSVPGWGNTGKNESYAEWYWWNMNEGPSAPVEGYQYNLEHYGPEHTYDDFMQNFTASAWDPKEWVDLFVDAGAQYFVQVGKHHDGYALFDLPENVTKRTSVAQPPYKNLLQMLFDAAERYQPLLHRAAYLSLPEWFNPAWAPYGFGDWPGGHATNPYTNATLPYTGYVAVDDYVSDIILPSMLTLASMGSELMWCDVGGANLSVEFAAEYFNSNGAKGKQVAINNRCGIPGDFDTIEYARYDAPQQRKWESNQGMDPLSWGYNRATPASAYITPQEIVTSLMDIISKNGNFLLDIGPQANGIIISVEQDNLRAAGSWFLSHAEAIYNTTYWFVTAEEGAAVRFTQNACNFYIITLHPPNSTLVLDSPVPYVLGDQITVVGGNLTGTVVPSTLLGNGSLQLTISDAIRNADEYSWVFKIPFGCAAVNATVPSSGANPTASASSTNNVAALRRPSAFWLSLGAVALAATFM